MAQCSDVQWYAVICSDVQWCAVMCSDVQWCAVMCSDVQWCAVQRENPNYSNNSRTLQYYLALPPAYIPKAPLVYPGFYQYFQTCFLLLPHHIPATPLLKLLQVPINNTSLSLQPTRGNSLSIRSLSFVFIFPSSLYGRLHRGKGNDPYWIGVFCLAVKLLNWLIHFQTLCN